MLLLLSLLRSLFLSFSRSPPLSFSLSLPPALSLSFSLLLCFFPSFLSFSIGGALWQIRRYVDSISSSSLECLSIKSTRANWCEPRIHLMRVLCAQVLAQEQSWHESDSEGENTDPVVGKIIACVCVRAPPPFAHSVHLATLFVPGSTEQTKILKRNGIRCRMLVFVWRSTWNAKENHWVHGRLALIGCVCAPGRFYWRIFTAQIFRYSVPMSHMSHEAHALGHNARSRWARSEFIIFDCDYELTTPFYRMVH